MICCDAHSIGELTSCHCNVLQGMLPALAPLLPHLAEDAWHSAPWQVPTASVFQSGWYSPPEQWQSMPDAEQKALRALKLIR